MYPRSRILKSGPLTCLYENGFLRYISLGKSELVRMIYAAVRDHNWLTVPYTLENEEINVEPGRFDISYQQLFTQGDIRYRTRVNIKGSGGLIEYNFAGTAESDFLANRIGVCVHLPVEKIVGTSFHVVHTDGTFTQGKFPTLISPHQPIKSFHVLTWMDDSQCSLMLRLNGDTFEMEDQRNWTDASYKVYSRPLELPYPFAVHSYEVVQQSVKLSIDIQIPVSTQHESNHICTVHPDQLQSLPLFGFGRSSESDGDFSNLLRELRPDHLRVELRFNADWKTLLSRAIAEAVDINTRIELVVFHTARFTEEANELCEVLVVQQSLVSSLIIHDDAESMMSNDLLETLVYLYRSSIPQLKIGSGSSLFFTELNRSELKADLLDFIVYPSTPQVHASDNRSVVENVKVINQTIETAKERFGGKPVYISPVTLRMRRKSESDADNAGTAPDSRQHSLFAAMWSILFLKYAADARSVTFFESSGPYGLLSKKEVNGKESIIASEFYNLLRRVRQFEPLKIVSTTCNKPLELDSICFSNVRGELLLIICCFNPDTDLLRLPEISGYEISAIEMWADDGKLTFEPATNGCLKLVRPGLYFISFIKDGQQVYLTHAS